MCRAALSTSCKLSRFLFLSSISPTIFLIEMEYTRYGHPRWSEDFAWQSVLDHLLMHPLQDVCSLTLYLASFAAATSRYPSAGSDLRARKRRSSKSMKRSAVREGGGRGVYEDNNIIIKLKLAILCFFRSKQLYLSGHIPEAAFMSLDAALFPSQYERFALYPPDVFEKYIQVIYYNFSKFSSSFFRCR